MTVRSLALPSSSVATLAPLGAAVLAMVSITLGASFAKGLFPAIGAAGTTTLRLALAAVILSLVLGLWRVRLTRRTVVAALPYGLVMGAMNLLFYLSIQRLPLGIALAIEFTGPLALALFYSRQRTDFVWIALAVAGLLLLLPLEASDAALDPLGVALALAAGVFWAAYIVTGQRAGAVLGAQAPMLGMIVAALAVAPFGVWEAGTALLQPAILMSGLAVAVLSSAIPYSLEMIALRRLPARSFGILTSGEPAVGAVMGMLLLGEMLPLSHWLGIVAVVGASIGTAMMSRRG
ncbi:EamA family transporter [Pararhodospirillum photometricum]|nr:EamA family transporter [Pararhodospirillum photometricum]